MAEIESRRDHGLETNDGGGRSTGWLVARNSLSIPIDNRPEAVNRPAQAIPEPKLLLILTRDLFRACSLPRTRVEQHVEDNQKRPGNYLSIDGGSDWLSALPALLTLNEMLGRLKWDLKLRDAPQVCKVFDLIMATGPAGLAALMIGKLGLTLSQAIDACLKLESALSVGPAKDDEERARNSEAFRKVFTGILVEAGFDENTPMQSEEQVDGDAKIVVCAVSAADLSVLHPLRSYAVRGSPASRYTILDVACASVASADKFLPMTIGSGHRKIVLVDAMAGYANPTKELLQEAQRVYGEDAEVATVVSLGCGKGEILSVSGTGGDVALVNALKRMALDSEQTHKELHGRLYQSSVYFRFNVERGLERQRDIGMVYDRTTAYLKDGAVDKLLDEAVKSIKSRQKGSTLKEINSVATTEIALKPRPSLVENFVGREDILEALRTTHLSGRSSSSRKPAVSVLMGLGGSGKTQTALKFALEYESKYPDGTVYFFNGSSEDKLKTDYATAIRARGTAYRAQSHDDSLVWFAHRTDDWLIIIDNADDPTVELFQFIPKSSRGHVIITTRNATHKILAPNNGHQVEGLSPSDAVALVLKGSSYADNEANRSYAQAIAKELGYLPLALAHAAAYISIHLCLPTYLSMYRKRRTKFLASRQGLPEDYSLSVATTVQMSLDSTTPGAREVMTVLARCDTSSIAHIIIATSAERMFYAISAKSKDEITDSQTREQANILMDIFCPSGEWLESDFNDIIRQCMQCSLLQVTSQGEAKFYSMHVLVQTYLQSCSDNIRGHRPERLVVRLLGSAVTIDNDYKYQAFNRLLVPHLKLVAADHVVEAGDHYGYGDILHQQGHGQLSIVHYERCLALRESSLGDKNRDTMGAMHQLALCYSDVGRHQEALELQVKGLNLQKRVSGDEHPDNLTVMGNLATSYSALGRRQEALELEMKVLDLRKRVSGDNHPSTLMAMNNLAWSYGDLGKYQEALELQMKVLDQQKRFSGDEHPDTLMAMNNIAMFYSHLGRYQEALELQMKVLDLRRKISGDEHPDTLRAIGDLAMLYSHLGRYQEALEIQVKVLDLRKRVLGDEHPETLKAINNIATFYSHLGRYQEALELQMKVLDSQKSVSGDEHPDTLIAMHNLAMLYNILGRYQEALKLKVKLLDLQKKVSGDKHPDTLKAMANLAISYGSLGKNQEALGLQMNVLDLRNKISGDAHPDTLMVMSHLAMSYGALERYPEALELEMKVLDLRKRVSGDEHPDTLMAMNHLAISYRSLERYQEALELQIKGLDLRKKVSGDEHPDTLGVMNNLGLIYCDMGRYRKALKLQMKVLGLEKRVLGDEHPDTLSSMGNLALTYGHLGRHQEALELQLKELILRKRLSSDEDSQTIKAMGSLARTFINLGRYQEGLHLREKVLKMSMELSGEKNLDTFEAMTKLAFIRLKMGMKKEAIEELQIDLRLYERVLGKEHPSTVEIREYLDLIVASGGDTSVLLGMLDD